LRFADRSARRIAIGHELETAHGQREKFGVPWTQMKSPESPELLARAETLTVVDGAIGTELLHHGVDPRRTALANRTARARVQELARAYVDAGAGVLRTNSFQANRIALAEQGLEAETRELNRLSAELVREASRGRARVFGSIGPIGIERRSPRVELERARDAYAEQGRALVDGGVDCLLLETFVDLEEAELALDALSSSGVPRGVSMSFDVGSGLPRSLGGATPAALCAAAERHGAAFVGANCGDGLFRIDAVLEAFSNSRLPIWLTPSAGVPGAAPCATAADFARLGARLHGTRVAFFGGCCGTDPSYVSAIARRATA